MTNQLSGAGLATGSIPSEAGRASGDRFGWAAGVGRVFFGLGILGLAVEHFIFGDFVTGRAPPWPEGVPGGRLWAYATGAGLAGIALLILVGRRVRPAALTVAGVLFMWAVLRSVPVVLASAPFAAAWTQAGKALVLFGGALAVAALAPAGRGGGGSASNAVARTGAAQLVICRVLLGGFLVLTGIQHFLHTPFVASLIPAWFPGDATVWTYVAGGLLIGGGIGSNVPRTARPVAFLVGLMVFSWFWIVHIPRTFASVSDGLAVFEALAVAGIAFMLAGGGGRRLTVSP